MTKRNSYVLMDSKAWNRKVSAIRTASQTMDSRTQECVKDAIHQIVMHKSTTRACQLIQAFNGGRSGVPDGRANGRVKALMGYVIAAIGKTQDGKSQARGWSEAKDGSIVLKLKKSFDVDRMNLSVLDKNWYELEPERGTTLLSPEKLLELLRRTLERASNEEKAEEITINLMSQDDVKDAVSVLLGKLEQAAITDKSKPVFDKAGEAKK